MRNRHFLIGSCVLLLVACDPGEDNDGPPGQPAGPALVLDGGRGGGGGGGGIPDTGGGPDAGLQDVGPVPDGIDFDGGVDDAGDDVQPVGNLACNLELNGEGCGECVTSNCGAELQTAFGVNGVPTTPGGACLGFLSCLEGCSCGDEECLFACLESSVDEGCGAALEAGQACQADFCDVECSNEPPSPTCGDGVLSDGEECELGQLFEDCIDHGFEGGTLACTFCEIDTSGCFGGGGQDACEPTDGTLVAPGTYTGALDEGDRTNSPRSPSYHESIGVTLTAGETYVISMTAEFDTYLYLMDDGCFTLDSNDDSEGTNSSLTFSPEITGLHYIVATSFSGGQTGPFTVNVSLLQ